MKSKLQVWAIIFGSLLLQISAAPAPGVPGVPAALIMSCMDRGCDLESGPVCAIDEAGVPRTFENRCMADLAYCRFGTFYADVKQGEC